MRTRLVLIILCAVAFLTAQNPPEDYLEVATGCNLLGPTMAGRYSFSQPSAEMVRIFDELIEAAGEEGSVYMRLVESANATNALATVSGNGRRLIMYNNSFVDDFKKKSLTEWSARFLLAHEIGHHYLKHNFGGKTREENHDDELAADAFAATILARLGAEANESVAGISTFLRQHTAGSETHPEPRLRIARISRAWQEEMRKLTAANATDTNPVTDLRKPLALDRSAFRNPWNIVRDAKATLDNEKVTFNFSLPDDYQRVSYKVCVFANSEGVSPGKNPGALSGTNPENELTNLGEGKTSVWNYRIDRYDREQVDRAKNLRFYVFDTANLPSDPSMSGSVIGSILGVAGLGISVYGISKIVSGRDLYENTYKITRDLADYEEADGQYVDGQWILAGGVALSATGLYALLRRARRHKAFERSQCAVPKSTRWETIVSADGIGLTYHF